MPSIRSCGPGSSPALYSVFASDLYRMSFTSVDLPDPLTPVTVVNRPSGMRTSMFFRLFARAPRMTTSPFSSGRRPAGVAIDLAPVRYAPVSDAVQEPQRILNLAHDALRNQGFTIGQLQRVERLQRLGDRQADVVGNRPGLHLDRQALELQPLPLAGRTRPERPVRLELLLLGPAPLVVAAPQIGNQPFQLPPPEQDDLARLSRQPSARHGQGYAEIAGEAVYRVADWLLVPF